jgi:hypothetical protein
MNNQIILDALEFQLANKKEELDLHETTTAQPEFKAMTQEVLESLREHVSNLIPGITLDTNRIEIMRSAGPNFGWSSLTVSLENDWRSVYPNKDVNYSAKMNWYGSSASLKDENILNDVQVFGAVASKLAWIEYEFLNNWKPRLVEIGKISRNLEEEIRQINSSIYSTRYQVRQQGIESYKKQGFSCTLIPSLSIQRNWEEKEEIIYELIGNIPNIQLSTGRGKWDYLYAKSFKVIKTNKYKTTLEVTQSDDRVVERTVSAKSFDQFIDSVYDWQTNHAKVHNDKMTQRYKDQYETVKSI